MEYVESDKSGECIFCDLPSEQLDRDRLVLHRGRHVFVLLNRYPYAAGHLMVAPYTHSARFEDLQPEVYSDLMGRIADGARVLEHAYRCDGFNIGANMGTAAGAGFADHLHFHVVPRWRGDTNFMTVVAETSIIPEHLERIFDELAQKFREVTTA